VLSRLGYWVGTAIVIVLAGACLYWAFLQPPAVRTPRREGVTVIKDVTLVNPGLGRSPHVDIYIRDGVIAAIGPTTARRSRDDLVCAGCYALPGLIDMGATLTAAAHVGDERRSALKLLASGVTAVRETGPAPEPAHDAIAAGRYPGPRLLPCQSHVGASARCASELALPAAPADPGAVAELVRASMSRQAAYAPRLAAATPDPKRDGLVRALFRAGAPIYAAGAAPDGESLVRELRAIVALGATPEGALVTATTSPGRFWSETTYGQVAIGLPADIVLYRADPTTNLDHLASRQVVIADGRIYPMATLQAWVERYRLQARAVGAAR
jgi:imidazolonepropionase-like amidohydrolase